MNFLELTSWPSANVAKVCLDLRAVTTHSRCSNMVAMATGLRACTSSKQHQQPSYRQQKERLQSNIQIKITDTTQTKAIHAY